MKKIILKTILLLLIIIFAGSFVTGPMTKSIIESQLAEINEMPGYQAELVEYNSSWRNANGKIKVGLDWDFFSALSTNDLTPEQKASLENMPGQLVLDMQAAHGPILTDDGLSLGLSFIQFTPDISNNAELTSFQQLANIDALFTYQTLIGLFGRSSFSFDSPPLEIVDKAKGEHFSYGGTHIEGSYQLSTKAVTAEGTFKPLILKSDNASFEVSAMELSADLVMLNPMVSVGEMDFKIAKFSGSNLGLQKNNADEILISDVLIRYEAEQDSEETVKMGGQYAIGEMVVADKRFEDMNFHMVFERLSLSALEKYYDVVMNLAQNMGNTPEVQQQQLAAITELGAEFLTLSPVVDITDLSFAMNGGKFSANARTAFDGEGAAITSDDLANPLALMARLNVGGCAQC